MFETCACNNHRLRKKKEERYRYSKIFYEQEHTCVYEKNSRFGEHCTDF